MGSREHVPLVTLVARTDWLDWMRMDGADRAGGRAAAR